MATDGLLLKNDYPGGKEFLIQAQSIYQKSLLLNNEKRAKES